MKFTFALLFALLAAPASATTTVTATSTGGVIRNFNSTDYQPTFTATDVVRVVSGGTPTTAATAGRNYQTTTTATSMHDKQIAVTATGTLASLSQISGTFSSSNTSVGTINASGYLTQVANGTTNVTYTTPIGVYSYPVTMASTSGTSAVTFVNWVAGLLPADMNSEVDALIAANGTSMNLFSSANDATATYVRNTAIWTGSANLAGVSVYSAVNGVKFPLTLITPTDAICAAHAPPPANAVYRWVDPSNNAFYGTITGSFNAGAAWSPTGGISLSGNTAGVGGTNQTTYTDIAVEHIVWQGGVTPSTLPFYHILPANYAQFVSDRNLNLFPVIGIDQERQVYIHDASTGTAFATTGSAGFTHNAPTESNRAPLTPVGSGSNPPLWSGDSGSPLFADIKGNLVLIGCLTTLSTASDPADFASALGSALTTVGSSYSSVTTENLTADGFSTQ